MVEEEKKGDEEQVEQPEEKGKDAVTLSLEQYTALLDRVAELEDASLQGSKVKESYSLEELADEGRSKKTKKEVTLEEADWDNLSGKELVQLVVEAVNQAGAGLKADIETLRVLREVDKCEVKYSDFWKYEKDIRKVATENPSLSIEKAYHLAKLEKEGEKGERKKGEKEETVEVTRTEKLLNLPPRFGGEKPGVVPSSTKSSEVKTLREAALKAWDEAVGKGKAEI